MAVYGKVLLEQEELMIENVLLETGLSKEDLTDKNKVMKAVEEEKKKKGPLEAIKMIFKIIGVLLLAVGIIVTLPIIIALVMLIPDFIGNIQTNKKNREIDKTIKQLQKTIEKLEKKKAKETDPEKIKEIDKAIKEIQNQIKKIEAQRVKEQDEKDLKNGLELIKKVVGHKAVDAEDSDELALWLTYYPISDSQFYSYISKYAEDDSDIVNYFDATEDSDWKDGKESYEYFKSNKLFGTKFVTFLMIDDTVLLYSLAQKKIWYGGEESAKSIKKYSVSEFRSKLKEFSGGDKYYKQLVLADAHLGYYVLSKAPEGVKSTPVPKYQ